jgi:hypothetical protein
MSMECYFAGPNVCSVSEEGLQLAEQANAAAAIE